MNTQETLLDKKVFENLIADLGLSNTRKFMDSMESEWQKRFCKFCQAIEDKSLESLATEASTLQSIAQVSGAYKLAELLAKLVRVAKRKYEEAFTLAQNVLTLADKTRFAFLELQLAV